MSLSSLIADTRKVVADDPANAQALFAAQGTLVGITEVDIRTGAHSWGSSASMTACGRVFPPSGSRSP